MGLIVCGVGQGITWWGPCIVPSRHEAERERLLPVWKEGSEFLAFSECLAPRPCGRISEKSFPSVPPPPHAFPHH